MREAELWARLNTHFGSARALLWAESQVIAELDRRTVREALAAGVPCKQIWRAAWQNLELPASER